MATIRPSGIKAPSKIAKPSSLPLRSSSISASTSSLTNADFSLASDSPDVLTSNTDDFIIGDRVFVNGTKPGYIQYIGETQFAPGEWAGVVLDEAVGKNDGSVCGVRYFQCEQKRGVFARLHRITRLPCANGLTPTISQYGDKTVVTTTRMSSTPDSPASSTKSANTSPRGLGPVSTSVTTTMTTLSGGLRVGDRVLVNATSGVKMGWLRYLGPTEFATGNWAGVELDEPIGKNDGSVAGKRYFECRMKFGLFAPLHKVSKMPSGRNSVTTTTTRVTTPVQQSGLQRGRSGSHESLNSSVSSASSLARAGRVRLGVKALATNTKKPSRPLTSSSSATHSALQEALKEKEEHIEQLLKERDMERSEVARAAAQVEETEQRLASVHADKQKLFEEIRTTQAIMQDQLESMELEKTEATLLLEDERKKTEDLQFRLEEESISRSELEIQSQEDQKQIKELEQKLEQERLKTSSLTQDSDTVNEAEIVLSMYKDNVESLSKKVGLLEENVKAMESKEAEHKSKILNLESQLVRKDEAALQLESSLESRKLELANLQQRLAEMEEELRNSKDKQDKQLEVIDGLNLRVAKSESCSSGLNEELQNVKVSSADLERQAKTNEERCEQLMQQKKKLEQQIIELASSSGDRSQHLTQLTNELRQKENLLDEVQAQMRSLTQELEKHKDLLEMAQKNTDQEVLKLTQQHQAHQEQLQSALGVKSKTVDELKKQTEDLSSQMQNQESAIKAKTSELEELQKKLHKQEAEGTLLRAQLQEAQLKTESLTQSAAQGSKQVEENKQQAQAQNQLLQIENDKLLSHQAKLEENLKQFRVECDVLHQEKISQDAAIKEREGQVAALQSETQRLKLEFALHKEDLLKKLSESQMDSQAIQELHQQLELQQDTMKKFQSLVEELEAQRTKLCEEMEEMKISYEGKIKLEKESIDKLKKQNEELNDRQKTNSSQLEKENATLHKELEEIRVKSQVDLQKLQSLEKKMSEAMMSSDRESSKRLEELSNLKSQCQKLEDDKRQLENKVVQLQVTLAKSNNQNDSDPESKKLKEEKEALEGQIEFLNSVIVDMQRKNDELNTKLTNLESESDLLDTTDLNLNGIRTVRPPRLFCDICDRFDLHDTEDCPTQCAEAEEHLTHSHHGAKRNEERPYCDSCEMFGHWTKNCDDGETF